MIHEVSVTFTETVTRTRTFDLDIEGDLGDLQCSDIHELLDQQRAWDQLESGDWLGGDIENRDVDAFEVTLP